LTPPGFRSLLGGHLGVDPHYAHADVLGEHGDAEVLTWSLATIAGVPLEAFARLRGVDLSERIRKEIDAKVRGAAYTIIGGMGPPTTASAEPSPGLSM
jgi:L-lactate dehydrogenase